MKIAAIVVHYRTPELARRCVEALRRQERVGGLDLEIVVVDNGSDAAGRALLAALPARLVEPGENLGYAGGANRGVEATAGADLHLVLNPDVLVEPGCVEALAAVIEAGASIAGPRFLWDRDDGDLLPPLEPTTRRWELQRLFALRERRAGARARRVWRAHAWRHWEATAPLESYALSGALLAVERTAWERVGPFDEGYALYFEETDWLERARQAGVAARHVPAARAVHLYAQSTPSEPRAAGWFAESQRRFREQHHGPFFTRFLETLERRVVTGRDADTRAPEASWPEDPRVRWIETSPSPLGLPAAGRPVEGLRADQPLVPPSLRKRLAPGTWWLRAVDAAGRELHARRLEIAEP